MSLIDSSYFSGPIMIPNLGKQTVIDNLNIFINRYEPKLLQAALGYELYEDFIDGLSQPVIDQKWLDLRDGVKFTANGMWPPFYWNYPFLSAYRNWYIPQNPRRKMEWIGFASNPANIASSPVSLGNPLFLIVDSGPNNPVSGTNTFTWSALAGSTYWVEKRGVGSLKENLDITITNNSQTINLIKPFDQFNAGEVYVIHFEKLQVSGTVSPQYTSPIAAYVYYFYIRDAVTQATGVGIVNTKSDNAVDVSPARKMCDAFNQMSQDVFKLWQFLEKQTVSVYDSYDRLKIDYQFFKPINFLNV